MSENNPKQTDNTPEGFDEATGPAAFKAQILREQEGQKSENSETDGAETDTSDDQVIDQGLKKIRDLETSLAETKDQLIRTVADMENLRKRAQREREDASKYAVTSFAKDLLEVADNFRRALDHIPDDLKNDDRTKPLIEGIEATERSMLRIFERNGIQKIEPMDEPFNPNFHEVMFEAPAPGKPQGMIIQLIEAGYVLKDRLLRAAKVGVAKGEAGAGTARNFDESA